MIITLKGVKDIFAKVKDNHSLRLGELTEYKQMSSYEKEAYSDITYLLDEKISTYEDIQRLTEEDIRITFKNKEVEIISTYMYYMES